MEIEELPSGWCADTKYGKLMVSYNLKAKLPFGIKNENIRSGLVKGMSDVYSRMFGRYIIEFSVNGSGAHVADILECEENREDAKRAALLHISRLLMKYYHPLRR